MTQLSLVEHALCPIDPTVSLRSNLAHEARYFFTDKQGSRRQATAKVLCPGGLSAHDELYLWGLLALTFSQSQPAVEFTATPHYCLRQLGLIEDKHHCGGETYRLFRTAIERLSCVQYLNDNFYDPLRGEHCQMSFGFFDYRLPLDTNSSRAWRFYWSPVFYEICQTAGSALAFDLETYRQFDTATRRLYLLLKKMFWKRSAPLRFDVRHLAVDVLGFSATQPAWRLKPQLVTCIERLVEQDILGLGPETSIKNLFRKLHKGQYSVMLYRGSDFDRQSSPARNVVDSPQYELLQSIGFELAAIGRILRNYPPGLVAEWIDITLAARERNGETFFKKSIQAYFIDNIREAANGKRTPPDWWRELRQQEEQQRRHETGENVEAELTRYIKTEARAAFAHITERIFGDLIESGQSETDARQHAESIARSNLRAQFYREHPECRPPENTSIPIQENVDE